ncbi:MAG: PHP domain-containing protein, partial [Chloroflexota bacterium]
GVELGTDIPVPEVHILGYFVDHTHPGFQAGLEEQRQSRVERAHQMLEKLAALGVPLAWERVQAIASGDSIGRPHIAQAMVEKGYVPTLREAFARYIGKGGPAYVGRRKLTPESAVELICRGQGLAVLAHPAEVGHLDELLPRLLSAGLVGMEAYYNNYPPDIVNSLLATARHYGLLPLGGSDYHGVGANDTPIGGVDIPARVVKDFLALAREKDRFCHPVG